VHSADVPYGKKISNRVTATRLAAERLGLG
jgi:hypothetical protein